MWRSFVSLKVRVSLCLFLFLGFINAEEKPSSWKAARTAWKKTGAWLYDENENSTKSAAKVRKVWFFEADRDSLNSLSHLKALPDPKVVVLTFGFMEPHQTAALVESATQLPHLKGIQIRYAWSDMTDDDLCLVSKIDNLRDLTLYGDRLKLTDTGLRCLGERCKLDRLLLISHNELFNVTDEGLAHLKNMGSLSHLSIRNARIKGLGLRHLEKLPIARLNLSGCPIDDSAWNHISKMQSLEVLDLFETQVAGHGIESLRHLPKLTKIDLSDTKVAAENVALLADCPHLTDLNLAFTDLDDESISSLAKLKQLKQLSLLKTKLTKAGVDRLTILLPETDIFY